MRYDLASYSVYRKGKADSTVSDLEDLWQDDLVTFVMGCSFSFDEVLINEGIALKHIEYKKRIPAYSTSLKLEQVTVFKANGMVTMRHFSSSDAERVAAITSQYPQFHGAPLHSGDPKILGIDDLLNPDYGDSPSMEEDDVPLFWACGMTIFRVMEQARLPLAIVVNPGHMLVTDKLIKNFKRSH